MPALINAGRSRAAMMSISDIGRTSGGEFLFDQLQLRRVTHHPGSVAHLIICREIDVGILAADLLNRLLHCVTGFEEQKNRSGLGVERLDMAGAIILLVRPRELMLFNAALQVI